MSNVLSEQTKQQVIALGRLGWSLRRIEQDLGVRRETASTYLKAAGILVQPPGRRREGAGPKPAISVSPLTTDSEPAKPALGESASDPDPARAAPPVTASSSAIRRAQPTRLSGSDPSPSASICEPFREAIELAIRQGRNARAFWQDLVSQAGFRKFAGGQGRFQPASVSGNRWRFLI
jgi:hypothetical protein